MPQTPIKLASGVGSTPDLQLPLDAVTQRFAFLGRTGSGKTYGAGKLAEEMLSAGAQVIVLDAVGNWYGLRMGSDGKRDGFDIPVLGGDHGDLALLPSAGELVAKLLVETGSSAVLDLSPFRKEERRRFVTAFAEEFFERKKRSRSPVHVIIEEAHLLVPQRTMKGQERMLGAMEDLIRLGRNYGIGITLIDQRPQSVSKDALNQTEVLLAFQLVGTQERKAIGDWAEDKGIGKGDMKRLSELDVGQAIAWSPGWLKFFGVVKLRRKTSFDASRTPEVDEEVAIPEPARLDPAQLANLQLAMASVAEEASARDPDVLQKKIRALEAEIHALKLRPVAAPDPPSTRAARAALGRLQIYLREATQHLRDQVAYVHGGLQDLSAVSQRAIDAAEQFGPTMAATFDETRQALGEDGAPPPRPRNGHSEASTLEAAVTDVYTRPYDSSGARAGVPSVSGLPRGAREMLYALRIKHPQLMTRHEIGLYALIVSSGGTFTDYLSKLRTAGLIVSDASGRIGLSESGAKLLGDALRDPPPAPGELIDGWMAKHLPKGARSMLDVLAREPRGLSRQELGQKAGVAPSGGTFTDYLSKLRVKGLLDEEGQTIRLHPALR